MKNLTLLLAALCLMFLTTNVSAYNYLYITDPHGWEWGEGTIEDFQLIIEPHGAYLEYQMIMSVNADQMSGEADAYEIVMEFDLPPGGFIHEAYLWVEDSCVQADLMSLWKANQIYENIVNRRKDPLIVKKLWYNNQYELRIYPLQYQSYRKFKLTYMVPLSMSATSCSALLPFEFAHNSNNFKPQVEIIIPENEAYGTPEIANMPGLAFEKKHNTQYGNHFALSTTINKKNLYAVKFKNPAVDGVLLNYYLNSKDEGFYQVALNPSAFLQSENTKNLLIILDYHKYTTSLKDEYLKSSLQYALKNNSLESTKFNLYYYKNGVQQLKNKWIDISFMNDSSTIFSDLDISNISHLNELLNTALSEYSDQLENLEIMIVSSSDNVGDFETANSYFNELIATYSPLPKFHIVDIGNENIKNYHQGGKRYYGNEYFYSLLAKTTFGTHKSLRSNNDVLQLLEQGITATNGTIHSLDFYTTVNDGFCYSRYNLFNDNEILTIANPIVQVGKFNGSLPFEIELSGFVNDKPFSKSIAVKESQITRGDQLNEKIWAGNLISALEGQNYSEDMVSSVLNTSLEYTVLSRYTAFLALEPGMEIPDVDEEDQPVVGPIWEDGMGVLIDVYEPTLNEISINVGPNPLIKNTIIEIQLDNNPNIKDYSVRIFNVMGQIVKTFDVAECWDGNSIYIDWDGTSDNSEMLANGTYMIVITSKTDKKTTKLVISR